jgi:hypothetical protein
VGPVGFNFRDKITGLRLLGLVCNFLLGYPSVFEWSNRKKNVRSTHSLLGLCIDDWQAVSLNEVDDGFHSMFIAGARGWSRPELYVPGALYTFEGLCV